MKNERVSRGTRATVLGIAANVLLGAAKLVAGLLGGSHALVADAVESLGDIISSVIVWRGIVVASAPPDDDHPYGHGKAEAISAAIVATLLLLAAVGIAVQSIRDVMGTHHLPKAYTLVVLFVTIVIKEFLFRFIRGEAGAMESSALNADAWHHRADAITSLAAAIGITTALIGGQNWAVADDVAALVAAGIIAWNGSNLLRPALGELMDAAPNALVVTQIRAIAGEIPEVTRVEKCFARKMGYQYFVDMHIEVHPQMTVEVAHQVAHQVKNTIRERMPSVRDVLVHVEPGH